MKNLKNRDAYNGVSHHLVDGVEYIALEQAYACNEADGNVHYQAQAVRADDEYDRYHTLSYNLIWDVVNPDAEDPEDACNWDEPYLEMHAGQPVVY